MHLYEAGNLVVTLGIPFLQGGVDVKIVVTDAEGQEHKFKAVFFNREQNFWMGQNYFNQGFQSGPFQGPHNPISQTQPRYGFGPDFGFRTDSETL